MIGRVCRAIDEIADSLARTSSWLILLGVGAGVALGIGTGELVTSATTRKAVIAPTTGSPLVPSSAQALNPRSAAQPQSAQDILKGMTTFQQLVLEAQAQSGPLNLHQLMALAQIAAQVDGRSPSSELSQLWDSHPVGIPGQLPRDDAAGQLLQSMQARRSSPDNTWDRSGSRSPLADDARSSSMRLFDAGPDVTATQSTEGIIDSRTGQFLPSDGAGGYVNPLDGTHYEQADPNGVLNDRTGEYDPISH